MADETQIELGDEAADNFRVHDPGETAYHLQRELLGVYGYGSTVGFATQIAAQRKFANEGLRASLAAELLRQVASVTAPDQWSTVAAKALAAAAIIYPDPEEAE